MSQLSTHIHLSCDHSSVHSLFRMKLVSLNTLFLKICFGAGAIAQNYRGGPGISSQNPHSGSQSFKSPLPGDLNALFRPLWERGMHVCM